MPNKPNNPINKHKLSVNLLGDIATFFDSICPLLTNSKTIKTNLQGRGVDKISRNIHQTISKYL